MSYSQTVLNLIVAFGSVLALLIMLSLFVWFLGDK